MLWILGSAGTQGNAALQAGTLQGHPVDRQALHPYPAKERRDRDSTACGCFGYFEKERLLLSVLHVLHFSVPFRLLAHAQQVRYSDLLFGFNGIIFVVFSLIGFSRRLFS